MLHRSLPRLAMMAIATWLALAAFGCTRMTTAILPVLLNQRPTVAFTAAPVSEADTAYYAYQMHWSGDDADGRVDHYEYAIDPVGGARPETTWVVSRMSQAKVYFRASQPDTNGGVWARDPHTFAIRAVDNAGAFSAVVARSFFAYTIAPTVQITNPRPSSGPWPSGSPGFDFGPDLRITWHGTDDDGVFHHGPVQYKYRLLYADDPEYRALDAWLDPRAARRYFASTHFAGWDSTGADSAAVLIRGLTPNTGPYLLLVVAFDEAGAYTGDWTGDSNMLLFNVLPSSAVSPRIGLWSVYFNYQYASGGFAPLDPMNWVEIETPAAAPLTIHWYAEPAMGYAVTAYRWKLDPPYSDETPRSDEATDWYHWSRWDLATTQATFGPLPAGSQHTLYVEARDNMGNLSIAVVNLNSVATDMHQELLVVDDTRLEVDTRFANGTRRPYTSTWPAAAELDTFMYAVGGVPWRGPAAGRAGSSPAGLLAGYAFDTLGTRGGYADPTIGVPLSTLGRYRHVLWLADLSAATKLGPFENPIEGMSALRTMSKPGHSSPLAGYLAAGGSLWLAGGAAGYAEHVEHNVRTNDDSHGLGHTVFANSAGELVPGRILYDFAHWRSEFVWSRLSVQANRSASAVGGWSHPAYGGASVVSAPDYSRLPLTMRRRALALGDSLPLTRTTSQSASYWNTNPLAVEYLTLPNVIREDVDPDPGAITEMATLDTLYELQGSGLATINTGQRAASMTYYHGLESPPFVFTGFGLWEWTRSDCAALVDFVLHDIWGMNKRGTLAARNTKRSVRR